MNKKDFIGGNGDASVVYSSEDINGEKTQSLVINGKEVDFTDPKSVEEAKEYFNNARNGKGSMFLKLFGINPDDIFNRNIDKNKTQYEVYERLNDIYAMYNELMNALDYYN